MDVKQFPDVFFSLVSIESFFSGKSLSDFSQLHFDSFGLRVLVFALPNVRDKLVETSHVGGSAHEGTEHL